MDSNAWLQDSLQDFVDVVLHHATVRPNKTAVRVIDASLEVLESLTFAELDRRARAIACWLRQQTHAGERALLAFPSGVDFLATFCGCLYAGVIAVPIYIPGRGHARAENAARIARNSQCSCVLTRSDKLQQLAAWSCASGLRNVPVLATDTVDASLAGQWVVQKPSADTIAFLQYTSGSTGTPRGVIVRHSNLVHNQQLMLRAFQHSADTRMVSWLPLYHDMGLIASLLQSVFVGGDLILMTPQTFLKQPDLWLRAITRFRGTSTFAPNFAYELCCERLGLEQLRELDLSSLRLAVNGAEPIRLATLEKFTHHFYAAGFRPETHCPGYGLAEATVFVSGGRRGAAPRIARLNTQALRDHRIVEECPHSHSTRLVSVGPLNTDQEIRIVDPFSRQVCPPDQVGEIWIRGRSISTGYWQDEPADWGVLADSATPDTTPFLRTGDLGFALHGELYVTGRIKDVIIINGVNHYPQDIEAVAQSAHPALRADRGAAFALETALTERVVIVQEVERSWIARLDPEAIVKAVASALVDHELPTLSQLVLVRPMTLPVTSSGKVKRRAAREGLLHGSLETVFEWHLPQLSEAATDAIPATSPISPALTAQDCESALLPWILQWLQDKLNVPRSSMSKRVAFAELGMDSVKAVEFSAALGEFAGTKLEPTLLWNVSSIADLVRHVGEQVRAEQGRG